MSRSTSAQRFVAAACVVVFAALLVRFRGFVLDDAFITYRFAENLASGQGPVWNPGEHPVEGYTSFLWMTANALAILCGLDPVIFSKAFAVLSALAVLAVLASACRGSEPWLGLVLIGGVALSPVFAFLVMQGMETALVTLLLLAATALAFETASKPTWKLAFALQATVFAGGLARPDSFVFLGGLLFALLARFVLRRDLAAVVRLGLAGLTFAIPGVAYMVWRVRYFGHLFPNAFYIKIDRGVSWIKPQGIDYATSFLVELLLPYLLLIGGLLAVAVLRREDRAARFACLARSAPILFGVLCHGLYLLTLVPIQGFLWRYAFPIFPALLYVAAHLLAGRRRQERNGWNAALSFLVAGFFVFWNLRFLPEVAYEEEYRTQYDRVAIGHALAGTRGAMFTSAAGAVPYYSRWKAVDTMGLVSEEVAHHGVSPELLRTLDPDLVVLRSPQPEKLVFRSQSYVMAEEYMLSRGYVAAAAVYRSFGHYMYLFVRRDSPLFDELIRRLTKIEGITYGDLAVLMADSEIPFYSPESLREAP